MLTEMKSVQQILRLDIIISNLILIRCGNAHDVWTDKNTSRKTIILFIYFLFFLQKSMKCALTARYYACQTYPAGVGVLENVCTDQSQLFETEITHPL
jgi:hypothetical protein